MEYSVSGEEKQPNHPLFGGYKLISVTLRLKVQRSALEKLKFSACWSGPVDQPSKWVLLRRSSERIQTQYKMEHVLLIIGDFWKRAQYYYSLVKRKALGSWSSSMYVERGMSVLTGVLGMELVWTKGFKVLMLSEEKNQSWKVYFLITSSPQYNHMNLMSFLFLFQKHIPIAENSQHRWL